MKRALIVVAVAVLLAGGAGYLLTRGPAAQYRVAVAGPATVTDALATTGTVQAVNTASVGFPSTGQVATVPVTVGQQVTAGQPLATLNANDLGAQVASAQSAVATAQARLAADQSGTGSAGTSAGRVAPAAYVTSTTSEQQNAVLAAQRTVDKDLTAASAAAATQQTACQDITTAAPATPSSTATPAPAPSQQDVDGCTQAIQNAQAAQRRTAADEHTLATAEQALSTALSHQQPPSPRTAPSRPAPQSQQKPLSGNGSRTGSPASPQQLAADQAAIDAAGAQLDVANQNLAAATLASPITGTIAQIDLIAGQTAGPQQHIVVLGPGANQIVATVSDAKAGQIKPGQHATITPDGVSTALAGTVTSIGMLSSTTGSGGAPSYPVTIAVAAAAPLHQGASAAVGIVTASDNAPVTVPTSAVHLDGSTASVTVETNGAARERTVSVGTIGADRTVITGGLAAGSTVVLADLTAPLPTPAGNNFRAFGAGGGGRGGGRPGG